MIDESWNGGKGKLLPAAALDAHSSAAGYRHHSCDGDPPAKSLLTRTAQVGQLLSTSST